MKPKPHAVVQRITDTRLFACIIPRRQVYAAWPTPQQAVSHAVRLVGRCATVRVRL
jgi:hypothetical protein